MHKSLPAVEVKLETEFKECMFARIQLKNKEKEKLLICLIYMSPSDSGISSNNVNVIDLFKEANNLDCSHKLFLETSTTRVLTGILGHVQMIAQQLQNLDLLIA